MNGGELTGHRHADWGVWLTIAICLTITALSLAAVAWRIAGNGPIFPLEDDKVTPATVAPAVEYDPEPAP